MASPMVLSGLGVCEKMRRREEGGQRKKREEGDRRTREEKREGCVCSIEHKFRGFLMNILLCMTPPPDAHGSG